jgi:shikimate dehydrogenase
MGRTVRGAVIGSPVEHSLSPLLHREAFDFLGLTGTYQRQEVVLDSLHTFFANYQDDFDYLSITMPLKEEALTLDVEIDPVASRIQSANTLYRRDEKWHLTSTDGSGLISALKHEGFDSFNRVLVLGAGGTARAVVGALDAVSKEVVVLGRTTTRREVLESAVTHASFEYIRWNDAPGFSDYDLVVNTTPAGAADLLADSLSPGSCTLLFDVIYKPWPTVLVSRWSDSGGTVINGVELLLYQGIQQLSLALNQSIDEIALATHLRPILRKAIR